MFLVVLNNLKTEQNSLSLVILKALKADQNLENYCFKNHTCIMYIVHVDCRSTIKALK